MRHACLIPGQRTACIRSRLRDTSELRQQRVTALRSEQPGERRLLFGVRLAKVLERRDREHAVDEILSATSRSAHAAHSEYPGSPARARRPRRRVGDLGHFSNRLRQSRTRNRLPKTGEHPQASGVATSDYRFDELSDVEMSDSDRVGDGPLDALPVVSLEAVQQCAHLRAQSLLVGALPAEQVSQRTSGHVGFIDMIGCAPEGGPGVGHL